jgi:hypothetical protein
VRIFSPFTLKPLLTLASVPFDGKSSDEIIADLRDFQKTIIAGGILLPKTIIIFLNNLV